MHCGRTTLCPERSLLAHWYEPRRWVARAAVEALGTTVSAHAQRDGWGGEAAAGAIGEVAIALAYTVEEDRAVTPWCV
jgi:hypothetical protein